MVWNSNGWLKNWHQKFNYLVSRVQAYVGGFYETYFNMYAALFFSLIAGACLGFTGDDCYGKIPFESPIFWCLLLLTMFFMFQTFILISLTFWRIVRLATVAICGHYLAYQGYGFWSLENIDSVKTASLSKLIDPLLAESLQQLNTAQAVCKPYAYANITYGQAWIILPPMALILICFFLGDKKAILGGESIN